MEQLFPYWPGAKSATGAVHPSTRPRTPHPRQTNRGPGWWRWGMAPLAFSVSPDNARDPSFACADDAPGRRSIPPSTARPVGALAVTSKAPSIAPRRSLRGRSPSMRPKTSPSSAFADSCGFSYDSGRRRDSGGLCLATARDRRSWSRWGRHILAPGLFLGSPGRFGWCSGR